MASDLPEIDLRQVLSLTDDTGILQHSTYSTPNPWHGYCTDDNCRALMAAIMHGRLTGYDDIIAPMQRYLSFLVYAFNPDNGRFRNFMSYDRHWMEEIGSEDSHARTLWALGVAISYAPNDSIQELATQLFVDALPAAQSFEYIRPWAYSLIGVDEYLRGGGENQAAKDLRGKLSNLLFDTWRGNAAEDWPWWEDELTWGNAKIPQAMLVAGDSLNDRDQVEAGLKALRWLVKVQTAPEGHITVIGNDGWFRRGGKPAQYDQQPLEVHALVDACLTAARITSDDAWVDEARRSFEWFTGKNDQGLPLYNPDSGGCHDGLHPGGVNANQGAESTLAYVLSVLDLHMHDRLIGSSTQPQEDVEPVGYGLVGAGRFGRFCLERYATVKGLTPTTVWDWTKSHAEALEPAYGLHVCETIDELVVAPSTSIVHIATTPATHARHAKTALMAGMNVLVEKPLATSLEDADELIEIASRKELRLSVDFIMRYGPLWEPVNTIVQERLLGAFLHGYVLDCAADELLPAEHWFWDAAKSGGMFVERGVHHFDLMRSWLGKGRVESASQFHRPDTSIVDQVRCTVCYGSHGSVDFYHGCHQAKGLERQETRLVFERGEILLRGWVADSIEVRAVLDNDSVERLAALLRKPEIETLKRYVGEHRMVSRRGREDEVDRHVRIMWSSGKGPEETYGDAVKALMTEFIHAVRDPRRKLRVTGDDGRVALRLALQATKLAAAESE